jgi:RNA polymerase sigma-70 factor (ECF subfamily)
MDAPADERQQIEHSRNGDPEAFTALVRAHQRMIHSLTYRMTGSLADAEDLAQATFLRAFQQLDSFRGDARFATWLTRIAINTCLNWKQRETRRVRLQGEWAQEQTSESRPDETLPQRVQEALLKLDPKQRAAVVLTVYDGLNHAAAARVLGCSETTVSWRVFAARRKLKRLLRDVRPPGGDS